MKKMSGKALEESEGSVFVDAGFMKTVLMML